MRHLSAATVSRIGMSLLLGLMLVTDCLAHGERAQQANVRMRTVNWYDVEIEPRQVRVGDEVRVSGRFRTSKYWPKNIDSVTGRVFLNVGTSGPRFVRLRTHIDGVSMIQSTSLELGRDYEFGMVLKARQPGRFHVHPMVSVEGAGSMVGPARWVDVTGDPADFENSIVTMFGREVDLETYNLGTIAAWHGLWFVVGGAWLAYWFRKRPLLIPRYRAVETAEREQGDGDAILTEQDRKVALGFLIATLVLIAVGYQWAQRQHPVTTPLRTAHVTVPQKPPADELSTVAVNLNGARYRIPGRSFEMDLTVSNNGSAPLTVSEFSTANIRFVNPAVKNVEPEDSHDLVASAGLRAEDAPIAPGETRTMTIYAEDALWETQRLTHMINDPDSIIAGLLFFEDGSGGREIVEIGGAMLPVFN